MCYSCTHPGDRQPLPDTDTPRTSARPPTAPSSRPKGTGSDCWVPKALKDNHKNNAARGQSTSWKPCRPAAAGKPGSDREHST